MSKTCFGGPIKPGVRAAEGVLRKRKKGLNRRHLRGGKREKWAPGKKGGDTPGRKSIIILPGEKQLFAAHHSGGGRKRGPFLPAKEGGRID